MSLTNKIFLSLVLGIVLGSLLNNLVPEASQFLLDPIDVIGVLFISALKMLIVPVVFFSIVSGVTTNVGLSSSSMVAYSTVYRANTTFIKLESSYHSCISSHIFFCH